MSKNILSNWTKKENKNEQLAIEMGAKINKLKNDQVNEIKEFIKE